MSRFFWMLGVIFALSLAALMPVSVAQAQPVRGLIVKLKPADASAAPARESPQAQRERIAAVVQGAGVSVQSHRAVGSGHRLLRLPAGLEGAELDATLRRLRLHPDVAWVEPDVLLKPALTPNDPAYTGGLQWHLRAPAGNIPVGLNMPLAWDRSTGGSGSPTVVAVLDTGIRFSHPDLAGKLLPGYDFVSEVEYANDGDGRDSDPSDPGDWVSSADRSNNPGLFSGCVVQDSSWHGTFIAGQIAAASNNGVGVAGINWNARVLPVRVSGKCGAFLSDILDGMRWAAGLEVLDGNGVRIPNPNPARIVNLSFGGDVSCSASYQDVIDEMATVGAMLVVAAGNNDGGALRRPADCRGVLTVGAVQSNGLKAGYSNVGSNMALMAPGGSGNLDIYSTTNLGTTGPGTDDYGTKRGTSFSAPMASAVASLMLAVNPALTPAKLIERMRNGARSHVALAGSPTCFEGLTAACNCTTATCGAGLLDANLALGQALNPVAVIADVAPPATGATLVLDGRASVAATGSTLVSYAWTLFSGSAVTIQNASAAQASVTLPATAGSFVFSLQVTDSAGRTAQSLLTVTSTAGGGSSSGGGGGGGALGPAWGLGLALLAAWAWRRRHHS